MPAREQQAVVCPHRDSHRKSDPFPLDDQIYFRHCLCVTVEFSPPREECYFWLSRDLNGSIDMHGGLEALPSP